MLSRKLNYGLLVVAMGLSLSACEKPADIVQKASMALDHREYIKSLKLDVPEEASAFIKTGYAKQVLLWNKTPNIMNTPFEFKKPINVLTPEELITFASKSLTAKDYVLTENEMSFVTMYLYSLSIDSINIVSSGLPKDVIKNSFALAQTYHNKLKDSENIKSADIYHVLASNDIDWQEVFNLTEGDSNFELLHKKSSLILSAITFGNKFSTSLSIHEFKQYIAKNEVSIYTERFGSILPLVSYYLVTTPYMENKDKRPEKTDLYLTYIMLQELPLLSDTAKYLKDKMAPDS
jgi:hypothetical protein